jgi:sporulation protein YlmC with PRC-barrel domain
LIDSLDSNLLTTVYGADNVTVGTDGSISITANADEPEEFAWVIEMVLTGDKAKRVVIPCGKITAIGDIVYKDSEVIGYELTITAYPDDSENTHYEYISA